ncbi:predicted protein [Nematostella vectensis]|uniref:ATP synthase-coupling factor 6, mitochondrial n=1 Tax=Nematostella vectensis TaxID=45351 RepID=A7SY16_NEMVE|nr:predicted protein [Nematostella vectensis]|eukprot:XP_001623502.1 predicted protein [Nematostella vectensis]
MASILRASRLAVASPSTCSIVLRRNIGTTYAAMAKMDKNADPIQRLFVEKLEAYKQKSKGGKLIDSTPEMESEIEKEREQIRKRYGGQNLEEFPKFDFASKA